MTTSGHDTPPQSSPTKPNHAQPVEESSVSATASRTGATGVDHTDSTTSTANNTSTAPTPSSSSTRSALSSRESSPTRSRARTTANGNGTVNAIYQRNDQLKQQQQQQQQQQPQKQPQQQQHQHQHRQQLSSPRRSDKSADSNPVTALRLPQSKSRSSSHDPSPSRASSRAAVATNANAASFNSNSSTPSAVAPPIQQKKLAPSLRSSATSSGTNSPLRSLSPREGGDKDGTNKPLPASSTATSSSASSVAARVKSRHSSPKGVSKADAEYMNTPSIVVEDSSPVTSDSGSTKDRNITPAISAMDGLVDGGDGLGSLPVKVRNTTATMPTKLETVEEGSQPATPGNELSHMLSKGNTKPKQPEKDSCKAQDLEASGYFSDSNIQPHEHGSDGVRLSRASTQNLQQQQTKRDTANNDSDAPRSRLLSTKSSLSRLAPSKSRSRTEPSTQNMTVETETVSSIPQTPIATNQGDRAASARNDPNGSIKLKPSNETIRPKRERKWTTRKPTVVAAGNASSKADVFEAKVASAVDEANSSDSEETFVYESNPPEPPSRLGRHHSRTPSTTSMHSVVDQRGLRSIGTVLDGTRGILGKRSMKFSTNTYNNPSGDDGSLERVEPGRHSRSGTAGGGSVHHHHIGRFGRAPPGANQPYFLSESESPFTQANKGRHSRHSSRPSSPGHANQKSRLIPFSSRKNGELSSYNMDLEASASEHTPLIGTTVRTGRVRTPRRHNDSNIDLHHLHYFPTEERTGFFGRCAGCFSLTFVTLVVILSGLAFLLATTKPLYSLHVHQIQNVLASEQELMLDLFVKAVNPNLVSITIADMDVNVFAKSKYVGSEKWWREHGGPFPPPHYPRDGDDDGSEDGDEDGDAGYQRQSHHHYSNPTRSHPEGSHNSTVDMSMSSSSSPPSTSSRKPRHNNLTRRRTTAHNTNTNNNLSPDSHLVISPIPDPPLPDHDAQTMLLGRIFHFDSPLTFEGSAFKRHSHDGIGEVRLRHPGNKTEAGGTERWERVLQHRFELIVRGVLKYQLPLSSRVFSAPVRGKVEVLPEQDGDDGSDSDGDSGGGGGEGGGRDGDDGDDGEGNGNDGNKRHGLKLKRS